MQNPIGVLRVGNSSLGVATVAGCKAPGNVNTKTMISIKLKNENSMPAGPDISPINLNPSITKSLHVQITSGALSSHCKGVDHQTYVGAAGNSEYDDLLDL